MLHSIPMPGDAVRLNGSYCGVRKGAIAILGGRVGFARDEFLATFSASAFRDEGVVSCSGGPAPFVGAEDLVPTGETATVSFWQWRDGISGAGRGEAYTLEVPLWTWRPQSHKARIERALDTWRFWSGDDAPWMPDAQQACLVLGMAVIERPRPDPRTLIDPGVPAGLRQFSVWLCETGKIGGLCDPMYVCNVAAHETGTGDGRGNFFRTAARVSEEAIQRASSRLASAYVSTLRGVLGASQIADRLRPALA